jgi:hypothetical protein
MVTQGPVTASTPEKSTVVEMPAKPREAAPHAKTKTLQYPYIAGELRRIGILAGIILVILIVLSIIIS